MLWLLLRKADFALLLSVALYALTWELDLYIPAYPSGVWFFNPFAWQLLFVFGAVVRARRRRAHEPAARLKGHAAGFAIAYLVFSASITLTWYVPRFPEWVPRWLESWMYPIDKTNLDVLRFTHFLALASIVVRFIPQDWPALKSKWLRPAILCGQHSLRDFLRRRLPGLCRTFHHGGIWRWSWPPDGHQCSRHRHYDWRGVARLVVQGGRGKERPFQIRRCGSGRRRIMTVRRAVRVLTLTLAAFAAAPVLDSRAQTAPADAQQTPRNKSVPQPPADHARRVRGAVLSHDRATASCAAPRSAEEGAPLEILAVGTGSSTIAGSDGTGAAWPKRLEQALRKKLPGLTINVTAVVTPRQLAEAGRRGPSGNY